MSITFRPATRPDTPLIIGIAGPTKSGKTYSAHRVAQGLANGKPVVMINAEGAKGHQYADKFQYLAADLEQPYRPAKYTEALNAALALDPKPGAIIIDSVSHMHDGPGGLLDYHTDELDRLAGNDYRKRDRMNFAAWVKPKEEENEFIYACLGANCHLILCFRAKDKIKIQKGKDPIDLGLQPISSDRLSFETIFTLMLPAGSKGIPDLTVSQMREPFDALVTPGAALDEQFGQKLAKWSTASGPPVITADQRRALATAVAGAGLDVHAAAGIVRDVAGVDSSAAIPADKYTAVLDAIRAAATPLPQEETE